MIVPRYCCVVLESSNDGNRELWPSTSRAVTIPADHLPGQRQSGRQGRRVNAVTGDGVTSVDRRRVIARSTSLPNITRYGRLTLPRC